MAKYFLIKRLQNFEFSFCLKSGYQNDYARDIPLTEIDQNAKIAFKPKTPAQHFSVSKLAKHEKLAFKRGFQY